MDDGENEDALAGETEEPLGDEDRLDVALDDDGEESVLRLSLMSE